MMDLDKELKNLKEDNLKAPKEFEAVMREALEKFNREDKKKNKFNNKYLKIALLFISFIFILNISTVSAMVKRLIGYNDYFSYYSYVKKLNQRGELQEVNEKISFSNGKEVMVEAIAYDNKYITIFLKGSISYADEFLPSNDPPKEYDDTKPKSNIRIIDAVGASGSGAYSEKDKHGDTLSAWMFKIGKDKNEFTLEVTEEGEVKTKTISIDSSKKLKVKNIRPENNEIEIEGVKFIVNNLRVSPLFISLDYSIVSEDEEKINEIKKCNGNPLSEGIFFMPNIEGKNIERLGLTAYDERETLENGIRVVENFALKNLAIDKFNNVDIVVNTARFSEVLDLDIKSNIKNKWVNDSLYIEELKYDKESENLDIAYWSKYNRNGWDKYLKYTLFPYDHVYMDRVSKISNRKEILGKDYKLFSFWRNSLNLSDGRILYIANDEASNIKKKDRTIKVKIDY